MSVKVSIIVPAYNLENYLEKALQSVLCQSYLHWECLIVNDGSTDGTRTIAESWEEVDYRFCCINQENRGLSNARNTGIQKSKGEFLLFLDADDMLYRNAVEDLISLQKLNKDATGYVGLVDFITSDGTRLWKKGRYRIAKKNWLNEAESFKKCPIEYFLLGNMFPCHAGIWRKEVVESLGGFDESLKSLEDYDLWLRVISSGYSIEFSDCLIGSYRRMPETMSTNLQRMRDNWRGVLCKKHPKDVLLLIQKMLPLIKFSINLRYEEHAVSLDLAPSVKGSLDSLPKDVSEALKKCLCSSVIKSEQDLEWLQIFDAKLYDVYHAAIYRQLRALKQIKLKLFLVYLKRWPWAILRHPKIGFSYLRYGDYSIYNGLDQITSLSTPPRYIVEENKNLIQIKHDN